MDDDADTTEGDSRRPQKLLVLDLVHDCGDWAAFEPIEPRLVRIAHAVASHLAIKEPSEAALALADDAHVRGLNRAYRGKDSPTNVLSFPAPALPSGVATPTALLGDIVLAVETVAREAGELDVSPGHHFDHLVVHGLLHLLGYDHETEDEAREMEGLEIAILADLGIEDPYAGRPLVD